MRIIQFDGFGQPNYDDINSGEILILLQKESIEIVQLKLLPPEEFGPELTKVKNSDSLVDLVKKSIRLFHPECLNTDRHWIFECPQKIKAKVIFR